MSLFDHLSIIEDTRSRINRQHDLVDIMFLVMAAIASGCEGWLEIEAFGHDHINWLRKYRRFENGIPTNPVNGFLKSTGLLVKRVVSLLLL